MSYLKIRHNKQEIELTPEAIKKIIPDLKSQIPTLTWEELSATVSAMGITIRKLLGILKEG